MKNSDTGHPQEAAPEPNTEVLEDNDLDPRDAALLDLPQIEWCNLPDYSPGILIQLFNAQGQEVDDRNKAEIVFAVDSRQRLWQFRKEEKTFETPVRLH